MNFLDNLEKKIPVEKWLNSRIFKPQNRYAERLAQWIGRGNPSWGVALSGGSARGFAYAGIFRFFEEHGVRPDCMAGTSAGSLFAALYADGYSSREIIELFEDKDFMGFARPQIRRGGFFKTDGFRTFLQEVFRHERLEELPIPLRIATTNLNLGGCEVFSEGPLSDIVTASCSIPILFQPVEIGEHSYVDGGLFKNLPASLIRSECDYLLGIHLSTQQSKSEKQLWKKSVTGVAERCMDAVFDANTAEDVAMCNAVIESPVLSFFKSFDLSSAPELADLGYHLIHKLYLHDEEFSRIIDSHSTLPRSESLL